MSGLFGNLLKQLREFFGRLSKRERTRLVILVIVVIVLAVVVVSLLNRVSYEQLYSGLTAAQTGDVLTSLDEMGVTYRLEGTSTILVPEGMASDLKARLASGGQFSDDPDLSILGNATGFGVTDAEKKEYYQYQLAQTIRQQILVFNKIQRCLVNVTLAKDTPFVMSQNNSEASAAVTVITKGGVRLTNAEANAIAEIVRTSVAGIKYENISITDSDMTIYKVGEAGEDIGADINTHYALENQLRQGFEDQILQLLSPIYGSGKVNVSARVVLDFDRQASESVVFEPPIAGEMEGIVRSVSELYENQRLDDGAGGAVGTETNGMGATEYPYGTLEDGDEYRKSLVEKNYEINETRTSIEKALGTVKELSIAVLIDSEAVAEDYTTEVLSLVSKALGIGEDYIAVARVPLQDQSAAIEEMIAEQEKIVKRKQMMDILETVIMWAVILALGLSFLSLIRMLLKNLAKKQTAAVAGGGIDLLADDEAMNYSDIELNAKPNGVEQLEKFIDKDSRAVAQLLRNWLSDD